jgi:drug/metabolite transporter (DMT)-like permease
MLQRTKSLCEIHFAVFLFGFSGLFGRFINLPAPFITCGRTAIAAVTLAIVVKLSKSGSLKLKAKKDYLRITSLGIILAISWIAFFYSIQTSSVAIGLLSTATYPVFATFLEPLLHRGKVRPHDVVIALITLCGVALTVPHLQLGDNITIGAMWGVISGFTFALLSVLNGMFSKKYPSMTIVFYQDVGAALTALPILLLTTTEAPHANDLLLLVVLGVVFTAVSHTLFVKGMRHVKAHLAMVIASLEPVYGIVLAVPLLGELPTTRTLLGGAIILSMAAWVSNHKIAVKIIAKAQQWRPGFEEVS